MPTQDDQARRGHRQIHSAPDRNTRPVAEDELVAWSVTTRDPRGPNGTTIELFNHETGGCCLGCGGFRERTPNVPADSVGHRPACPWLRLVGEVVRLRSDEWLERAAPAIAGAVASPDAASDIFTILRKHRDGKA